MSSSSTTTNLAMAMAVHLPARMAPVPDTPARQPSTMTLATAIACIALVAVDLRPGIVSVGPLLGQIRAEFGISNTQASLLTAIPNVLMGLLAIPTPWLARRFGRDRVILAALVVLSLATLARAFVGSTAGLLATTAGVGVGIAIAGALIAGFAKARFPRHVPLLMGLYAMSLGLGSTIAAALTGPVAALGALGGPGGGWRLGTGVWALPGLTAIAAWLYVARYERGQPGPGAATSASAARVHPVRSGAAWRAALYFATNNFLFFGLLSWIAPMYREFGLPEGAAGLVLASFTTGFMLSNPLPALLSRTDDRRWVVGLFAALALGGMLAMAIAPLQLPLVVVPLIACGIGGSFALGMTLPLDHAASPDDANARTAFTLSVGYFLGALGPLALGLLRDLTGNFGAALWALVAVGVVKLSLAPFLAPARHQG